MNVSKTMIQEVLILKNKYESKNVVSVCERSLDSYISPDKFYHYLVVC